jgi:hypothetical protein
LPGELRGALALIERFAWIPKDPANLAINDMNTSIMNARLTLAATLLLCGCSERQQAQRPKVDHPQLLAGKWKAQFTHPAEQRITSIEISMNLPESGTASYEQVVDGNKVDRIDGTWRKADNFLIIDREGGGFAAFRVSSLAPNQATVFTRMGQIITFNRIP